MMKQTLSILLITLCSVVSSAQSELPDHPLPGILPPDSVTPGYMRPITTPLPPDSSTYELTPQQQVALQRLQHTIEMPSLFAPNNSYASSAPSRVFTAPGYAGFNLWQGGYISATGASSSLPGLMGIENGSINFNQILGPLSFNAFASATHYGYFRGLQTSYGFGGSIDYRLSNRISLTVFGAYYTGLNPVSPAMAGFMNASTFGGYASFDFNDHWGISVGAQSTRFTITNRWETAPIVKPYYRFNRNVALGVDLGSIIYQIIQARQGRYRHSNPTVGPLVGGMPPVAPRR